MSFAWTWWGIGEWSAATSGTAHSQTLSARSGSATILAKIAAKGMGAATVSAGRIAREAAQAFALGEAGIAALGAIKAHLRPLALAASSTTTVSRAAMKSLSAAAAGAASLLSLATRRLQLSASLASVASLAIALASRVVANPARALTRFVRHALSAVLTPVRNLAAPTTGHRSHAPDAAPARVLAPQQPPKRQV